MTRCEWAGGDPLMQRYHDEEWGVPVHSDRKLFEFLVLDAAQAGLSWMTILRKREGYRAAFAGFDPERVAAFTDADIERLMLDSGIVRNRAKITSTITNARRFLEVRAEFGTFDAYIWTFVGGATIRNAWVRMEDLPARTPEAEAMSRNLVARGFRFVGPTICYAFMQAAGLVNDHTTDCFRYRAELGAAREGSGRAEVATAGETPALPPTSLQAQPTSLPAQPTSFRAQPTSLRAQRSNPDHSPAPFDVNRLRAIQAAFPVLERVTYLNTGTYGPMPAPALEAFLAAQAELERDGVACRRPFAQESDALRGQLASLVGADPSEIGFTANATDGLNIVLAGVDWQPGDEVITTDEEHEALWHPLLYLQTTRGIVVKRVQVAGDPDVMLARLGDVCGARTRLLGFSHVTCETGARLPAAAMCGWARERGVRSLLDVAQSFGAVPVNVSDIGCDYMAANGHKWLHGPKGTGFVFARRELITEMKLAYVGAGSLETADSLRGVAKPWSTASRFEFGTRPYALLSGWKASLDWMLEIGLDAIQSHILALGQVAIERLSALPGVRILTPAGANERAGLISFSPDGQDAGALGTRLHAEHAIVTRYVPHYNALRVAMAHFTCEAHLDRLLSALR